MKDKDCKKRLALVAFLMVMLISSVAHAGPNFARAKPPEDMLVNGALQIWDFFESSLIPFNGMWGDWGYLLSIFVVSATLFGLWKLPEDTRHKMGRVSGVLVLPIAFMILWMIIGMVWGMITGAIQGGISSFWGSIPGISYFPNLVAWLSKWSWKIAFIYLIFKVAMYVIGNLGSIAQQVGQTVKMVFVDPLQGNVNKGHMFLGCVVGVMILNRPELNEPLFHLPMTAGVGLGCYQFITRTILGQTVVARVKVTTEDEVVLTEAKVNETEDGKNAPSKAKRPQALMAIVVIGLLAFVLGHFSRVPSPSGSHFDHTTDPSGSRWGIPGSGGSYESGCDLYPDEPICKREEELKVGSKDMCFGTMGTQIDFEDESVIPILPSECSGYGPFRMVDLQNLTAKGKKMKILITMMPPSVSEYYTGTLKGLNAKTLSIAYFILAMTNGKNMKELLKDPMMASAMQDLSEKMEGEQAEEDMKALSQILDLYNGFAGLFHNEVERYRVKFAEECAGHKGGDIVPLRCLAVTPKLFASDAVQTQDFTSVDECKLYPNEPVCKLPVGARYDDMSDCFGWLGQAPPDFQNMNYFSSLTKECRDFGPLGLIDLQVLTAKSQLLQPITMLPPSVSEYYTGTLKGLTVRSALAVFFIYAKTNLGRDEELMKELIEDPTMASAIYDLSHMGDDGLTVDERKAVAQMLSIYNTYVPLFHKEVERQKAKISKECAYYKEGELVPIRCLAVNQ